MGILSSIKIKKGAKMWRSVEDPPSTNRDVVVSDGEGGYVIAFYDHLDKTWNHSDITNNFEEGYISTNDIKLWCEIPKLNE